MYKEYLHDSFKNTKYDNHERCHYIILTFDLINATSSVYKEIDEHLEKCNFKKRIRAKVHPSSEEYPYEPIETPKNTYIAIADLKKYKNLNRARDTAEKVLRDFLDNQVKWSEIEGYNYLVFVAKEWSWAAGKKGRS